jgi:hypothetical protein
VTWIVKLVCLSFYLTIAGLLIRSMSYRTIEGSTDRIGSCHQDRGFGSSGGPRHRHLLHVLHCRHYSISIFTKNVKTLPFIFILFFSFTLGVIGLPACGGIYPLMKRWVYWPSLFLSTSFTGKVYYPYLTWLQGFASSWGVPFAWVAATGRFDWGMILTVAIASCW